MPVGMFGSEKTKRVSRDICKFGKMVKVTRYK